MSGPIQSLARDANRRPLRVVLLKGQSAYDALRIFLDEIQAAFERRGDQVIMIDLLGATDVQGLLAMARAQGPVDLVYSFNILAEYRDGIGQSIAQILGAPHVFHYVDYPFTHLGRLEATRGDAAILTIDPSHAEAVSSVYGPDRFGFTGFCPHAAIGEPALPPTSLDAFVQDRPIPVLFMGTFYKADTPPWAALQGPARKVMSDAADLAASVEWMPALDAVDQALRSHGFDPAEARVAPVRKSASMVHEHVRANRRFEALKAAARAKVPLQVFGHGYEKHLYRFKNVTYGGEAGFRQTVELMRQSRVVLNINANFGRGSHERPLTALLAGAAVATDASAFYADAFVEGQDLQIYRWQALDDGMAALAQLASDPKRAMDMALSGQAKVAAGHRWDHRLDTIIAAADAARSPVPA